MDFTGLSLTGPICPIYAPTAPCVVGTGAGATAGATLLTAAQVVATTVVTVNPTNQALIAQQGVATTVLAATLPTEFNWGNLPFKANTRYENHLSPSYLMTETDIQPFPTPTGEVCPVLSYLDLPIGSGVTRQPNSKQIITRNGQFFSLGDQGNCGL